MEEVQIDPRAENTIRAILSLPIKDFVVYSRGHDGKEGLVKEIDGTVFESLRGAIWGWSSEREKEWIVVNNECKISTGVRIVTFELFKKMYVKIHANGISDSALEQMYVSFPSETICEIEGKTGGKFVLSGVTKKIPPSFATTRREAQAWQNMNPEWYTEAARQFVR